MGWNDASNNEAYMAGKLVSTNNGREPLLRDGARRSIRSTRRPRSSSQPGGPAGSFVGTNVYNWGVFQKSKNHELSEDLIRWV